MGQIRPEEEPALRREAEEALSKGRLPGKAPFRMLIMAKTCNATAYSNPGLVWLSYHAQCTVVCLKLMHSGLMVAA